MSAATQQSLKTQWHEFRQLNLQVRIRDAAAQLGVSEIELLATSCGEGVTRLETDWRALVSRLGELGPVMALTRNEQAVIEKDGRYQNIQIDLRHGLILDAGIDLRLFMDHWRHGFAVEQEKQGSTLRSLQFFDRYGTAVHKVYLREASDEVAFFRLRGECASTDQSPEQVVAPPVAQEPGRTDAEIDVAALRSAWQGMQDTHEFFHLLKKCQVSRTQALRLAGAELAYQVDPSSLHETLHLACHHQLPIMIFVSSPGVVQIHSGLVHKVHAAAPWLNVLDPGFNLHVREDQLASAWVVRKPTRDGVVSSLELYNAQGETVALLFGLRKEGQQVMAKWNEVLAVLPEIEEET